MLLDDKGEMVLSQAMSQLPMKAKVVNKEAVLVKSVVLK